MLRNLLVLPLLGLFSRRLFLFTLPGMDDPVRSRMIVFVILMILALVVVAILLIQYFRQRK